MTRKLKTSQWLSWLWLSSVVLFLSLRISTSFELRHEEKAPQNTQHEWILVSSHSAPAPVINPDFRLESAFPEPLFEFHFVTSCTTIFRAYGNTVLAMQELVRILESSIQINAP